MLVVIKLHTMILFFLILAPVINGTVINFEIFPEEPMRGDVVKIVVNAGSGEKVAVLLTTSMIIPVVEGLFVAELSNVEVPQTPNSFSATAYGVQRLDVSVKVLFWITKAAVAADGVATVTQSNVPPGHYDLRVGGVALDGISFVKVVVSAKTTLTMGIDGTYVLDYNTGSLPPGNVSVQVGYVTKVVKLGEARNLDPMPVISCDRVVESGTSIVFYGSESRDPDGSIISYMWNFGDGTVAQGVESTHSYSVGGVYTVSLSVVDDRGSLVATNVVIEVLEAVKPQPPPFSLDVLFLFGILVIVSLALYFFHRSKSFSPSVDQLDVERQLRSVG